MCQQHETTAEGVTTMNVPAVKRIQAIGNFATKLREAMEQHFLHFTIRIAEGKDAADKQDAYQKVSALVSEVQDAIKSGGDKHWAVASGEDKGASWWIEPITNQFFTKEDTDVIQSISSQQEVPSYYQNYVLAKHLGTCIARFNEQFRGVQEDGPGR